MAKYIVAGVTGRVGSVVAAELLSRDQTVRVIVRHEGQGLEWAQRGAEVAVGSLDDHAFVARVVHDAAGFFTLLPENVAPDDFHGRRRRMVDAVASGVREGGVPHVVMLSAIAASLPDRNGPAQDLHYGERRLATHVKRLTVLRACYFQDNVSGAIPAAVHGSVYPNFLASADTAVPMIATRDIGRFAADALQAPPHGRDIIDLFGPAYSIRHVAQALGAALNKQLHVVDIPPARHIDTLVDAGVPRQIAVGIAEMFAAFNAGLITPQGDRSLIGQHASRTSLRGTFDVGRPPSLCNQSTETVLDTISSLVYVREAQRRHWTSVADAWGKWFDWIDQNFAPLTAWLRDETAWRPGANVLDIGCGSGYPALAAAASVVPGGSVTAVDISPKMISVASRRAAEGGLDNLVFRQMDADALGFADETFDGVTCVCTLMFSSEPGRAISEIRRVLKHRGRVGIVVWDEPSRNPFSMILVDLMRQFTALPVLPSVGAPGPFRFAAADALESLLQAGGFSSVTLDNRVMTFDFASVDAYLQIVSELAGWTRHLEALSSAELAHLKQAVADAAEPYCNAGRVRVESAVHCAAGEK
jgi:ubiquinone/menaquinone biosynthesis C-methylase UbiE/uncharacterized protein YbjT (DUF2867 family)